MPILLIVGTGERDRFIAGDPLRAVGAVGVLIFHSAIIAGIGVRLFDHGFFTVLGRVPIRLIESCNFGVSLFFALSGYLLGRPFVLAFIHDRPLPPAGRYLEARALRLLPGLLAVFVITVVLLGTYGADIPHVLAVPALVQVYASSHFAVTALDHYWTLDAEALYYLLLPLAAYLGVRIARGHGTSGSRRASVIGFALLIAAVSIALSATAKTAVRASWFPMVAFGFAPGLILAALSTSLPARLRGRPGGLRLAQTTLAAALVPLAFYVASAGDSDLWARNLAAGAAAGLILAAALIRQWTDGSTWRALDNRPLQWLGRRSYSFYLFHLLVLRLLYEQVTSSGGPRAFAIYLAVSVPALLLLSAIGYRTLEAPFIGRRPAWRSAPPRPDPPVLLTEAEAPA